MSQFCDSQHRITLTLKQPEASICLTSIRRERQNNPLSQLRAKLPYGTCFYNHYVQRKMWKQTNILWYGLCTTVLTLFKSHFYLNFKKIVIVIFQTATKPQNTIFWAFSNKYLNGYSLSVDTHLLQTVLNPEAICLFVSTQQVMSHDGYIIWSAWGLSYGTLNR